MDRRNNKQDRSELNTDSGATEQSEQSEFIGTNNTSGFGTVETDNGKLTETSQPGTTETPKGKGGRPKGSKTKSRETGAASFSVSEKTVKPSAKRPAKPDERKLFTPDESKATTETILAIVEGLSVSTFGENAQFTNIERTLLEESIPRMLERMSVKTAETTANVLYPAMLGFASVSYALRIIRMNNEKRKNEEVYTVDVPSQNGQNEPQPEPVSFNPYNRLNDN